jgi:hypothetical protein
MLLASVAAATTIQRLDNGSGPNGSSSSSRARGSRLGGCGGRQEGVLSAGLGGGRQKKYAGQVCGSNAPLPAAVCLSTI